MTTAPTENCLVGDTFSRTSSKKCALKCWASADVIEPASSFMEPSVQFQFEKPNYCYNADLNIGYVQLFDMPSTGIWSTTEVCLCLCWIRLAFNLTFKIANGCWFECRYLSITHKRTAPELSNKYSFRLLWWPNDLGPPKGSPGVLP